MGEVFYNDYLKRSSGKSSLYDKKTEITQSQSSDSSNLYTDTCVYVQCSDIDPGNLIHLKNSDNQFDINIDNVKKTLLLHSNEKGIVIKFRKSLEKRVDIN